MLHVLKRKDAFPGLDTLKQAMYVHRTLPGTIKTKDFTKEHDPVTSFAFEKWEPGGKDCTQIQKDIVTKKNQYELQRLPSEMCNKRLFTTN